MTTRSLEDLRDLAPGYVMQSLTPEELAAFEHALRDPAMAAALAPELEAYRATVELLATAQPMAPPPSLRNRVQERIAQEARATAAGRPAGAPHRASPEPATPPSPPRLTVVDGGGRSSRALPIGLALAFAASALFALNLQREVGALRATMREQTAAIEQTRQQLAERDATLRTLTDGGNALLLVRLNPNAALGPNLQVFWNVKQGRAVIHASGLKALPDDRTYQLWMIRDGKPVSVALFRPDASGAQLLGNIAVPSATAGVAAFAVTEEPAAGSTQPTMTPFLVGAVAPQD
jgi:anti-sigma-K factor RskA